MSRRSARTAVKQINVEMEVDDEEDDSEEGTEQGSDDDENDESEESDGDDDDDKGSSSRCSRELTPASRDGSEVGRRGGRGGNRYSSPGNSAVKKTSSRASKENEPPRSITGITLSMEEMIQNTVLYLLVLHHKKTPIKRADIVKNALNGQIKSYPEVMEKVKDVLAEKFGIELVGVEEAKGKTTCFASYILVAKFPMFTTECGNVTRSDEVIAKRTFLYIILITSFMSNRLIEEEMIWKIYEAMIPLSGLCKKKDDLRRFLRTEYVSTLYLKVDEQKETEQISCRYGWGLRADKEYSKYEMLKTVAKNYTDKKPYDFSTQYAKVLETEKEAVEADSRDTNMADGDINFDETDAESQTITFTPSGVARVEYTGGGHSPRTDASGSVNGSVRSTNGRANSESGSARTHSGNEDDQESGSDNESNSGSDAAQDRSDAGSVSSSGSHSSSDTEG